MKRPLVALLLLSFPIYAADRLVPSQYETIQQAIYASSDGDVVIVAPGTYTGTNNRDITFQGKPITVRSTNPADPLVVAATVVDAQGTSSQPHRGFTFRSGETEEAILDGLTIRGGYMTNWGGGIFCDGNTSPTIRRCRIMDNTVVGGGGGIYVATGRAPTILDCEISSNWAIGSTATGGGCNGANLTRCLISGNVATSTDLAAGGGAYSQGNTFDSCVFKSNTAAYTGGYPRTPLGGGLCGCGTVISCTFTQNKAAQGGAAYCGVAPGGGLLFCNGPITLLIANSILYGDQADEGAELAAGQSVTITTVFSNIQGGQAGVFLPFSSALNWGDGMLHVDPMFRSDGYHLERTSPCVDRGSNLYTSSALDIDQQNRVMNSIVDIGADETPPYIAADFDGDGDVDGDDVVAFVLCQSGPDVTCAQACEAMDLDRDRDVDQNDFGILQKCFTGKGWIGDGRCGD